MTTEDTSKIDLPPHAYVPGRTPRHADGTFDDICTSAKFASGVDGLARSKAWQTGLEWLRDGYYWEAHELFEAVWMALPEDAPERQMVQALIQVANGHLKFRMGRPEAARRVVERANAHLRACRSSGKSVLLGIDIESLAEQVAALAACET